MATVDRQDEDTELVRRTLSSDGEAFGELYERYRERVYRVAYHFVHNKADALDLAQEVFIRAYQALAGFRGKARFSTWGATIFSFWLRGGPSRTPHPAVVERRQRMSKSTITGHLSAALGTDTRTLLWLMGRFSRLEVCGC